MKRKLLISFGVVASLMAITALALPTILHTAGLHPEFQGEIAGPLPGRRALIITTSHDVLSAPGETTGDETGVMASELTHPYYSFLQSGLEIDVASIKGGQVPVDPQTLNFVVRTPEDERYMDDAVLQAKVTNSIAVEDVDFTVYDIVFLSGGWGAAYDLGQSPVLGKKISEAF